MTLADRIVVMKAGYVQQVGTPYQLYYEPENVFVAGFIGEPPMNFIRGTVHGGCLSFGNNELDLSRKMGGKEKAYEGKEIILGFRPEHISLQPSPDSYEVHCRVELTEMLGDNTNIYILADKAQAILKVDSHDTPETDIDFTFHIPLECVYLFDAETENRIHL
jgi:multiple sugar transport system ATP-binding protein